MGAVLLVVGMACVPRANAQSGLPGGSEGLTSLEDGLVITDSAESDVPGVPDGSGGDGDASEPLPGESGVDELVSAPVPAAYSGLTPASNVKAHPVGDGEQCAEESTAVVDLLGDGVLSLVTVCDLFVVCGAERIDDLYSGRLAASGSSGVYSEYLTQVITGAVVDTSVVIDVDVDGTSLSIIGAGLGNAPDSLALPVFYWCRDEATGIFFTGTAEHGARFGWDTSVWDEYPVDAALDALYERVRGRLDLYVPEVRTAPPFERGAMIIRFPTWMWVDEPLAMVADAESAEYVRIEMRARLVDVEWSFGEDDTMTCSPEQMRVYIEGDDPFDEIPECHRVFETAESFDFASTLNYVVERRVMRRFYPVQPWPDVAWEPHSSNPTAALTTDIGEIAVHELRSVVVREETSG